jgi:hypothetical protein
LDRDAAQQSTKLCPVQTPSHITLRGCPCPPRGGRAMVIHELATNAVKHGSLHDQDGAIEITWEAVGEKVRSHWAEHGPLGLPWSLRSSATKSSGALNLDGLRFEIRSLSRCQRCECTGSLHSAQSLHSERGTTACPVRRLFTEWAAAGLCNTVLELFVRHEDDCVARHGPA